MSSIAPENSGVRTSTPDHVGPTTSPPRPSTAESTSSMASQDLPPPFWSAKFPPTKVTRSLQGLRAVTPPPQNEQEKRGGLECMSQQGEGNNGVNKPQKKTASVTPRRFTRFFTPRSHTTREVLDDITTFPANRHNGIQSSPIRSATRMYDQENRKVGDAKRRKIDHAPDNQKYADYDSAVIEKDNENTNVDVSSSPCARPSQLVLIREDTQEILPTMEVKQVTPIRRLGSRGLSAQLLDLNLKAAPDHERLVYSDFRNETAAFHTRPSDAHYSRTLSEHSNHRIAPFCTASLNTNSLIAVGDQEGRIRLLESTRDIGVGQKGFGDVFLGFQVHNNAIIDMAFTEDDTRLATASGDQTARIVDMATQTTISVLGNHSASLKQVRFQPGEHNNNVLATASRDGCIQIWDLRCKGEDGPAQHLRGINRVPGEVDPPWSRPINSIYDAHRQAFNSRSGLAIDGNDIPTRGEAPGRTRDVSVTCMSFLDQQHLLATGAESDASIKLWDLRSLHNRRNKTQTPVSQTTRPESHSQWRHFGTTSLSLGADGSKLYSLCKDNTVYTYSTAHLILGQAPELSETDGARRLPPKETREGLGPIYGYRHPQLHATSFYIKTAIRKPKDGKCEMLAVGSSEGCVILFPTDDMYFSNANSEEDIRLPARRGYRPEQTLPISTNGTALIRGHDKEAGAISWTSEGNLISVADDDYIRVWRDDGDDARDLRMGGETGGRRWACGWADVGDDYDEDR